MIGLIVNVDMTSSYVTLAPNFVKIGRLVSSVEKMWIMSGRCTRKYKYLFASSFNVEIVIQQISEQMRRAVL